MCHGDRATASGPGPGDNTGLASEADDQPRTSCLPRRGATRLASIETARLAGILHGLTQAGFTVPVVGVVVGADPVKRLDKWAPIRWRDLCTLVRTHVDDFRKPARVTRQMSAVPQTRRFVLGGRNSVGRPGQIDIHDVIGECVEPTLITAAVRRPTGLMISASTRPPASAPPRSACRSSPARQYLGLFARPDRR